jgi:8-amino-7-oxononanoate synthase
VPDFTSALYLGLRHGSCDLRPWSRFSTGRPAVLESEEQTRASAARAAALVGCERAVFAPSTLHLFWDAFVAFGGPSRVIYLDRASYPIARWGAERAAAHGARLRLFPHHDVCVLERLLRRGEVPIVATDGYCPACRTIAPLAEYAELVGRHGGVLLVDDTQALGVLGCGPGPSAPFGRGGGGSLRWSALNALQVVVAGSMAKGFGVPIAMLAGSAACINRFVSRSETRVHCSPPSTAALRAAEHALNVNARCGDAIRDTLAARVSSFRRAVHDRGLTLAPDLFPVQTLETGNLDACRLHRHLLARGVRAVLHQATSGRARLSFLITAGHREQELRAAAAILAEAAAESHHVSHEEDTDDSCIPFRA